METAPGTRMDGRQAFWQAIWLWGIELAFHARPGVASCSSKGQGSSPPSVTVGAGKNSISGYCLATHVSWVAACLLLSAATLVGQELIAEDRPGAKPGPEAKVNAPAKASADTKASVPAEIGRLIRAGWQEHEVVPAPAASDGEWCRRVYLDLIGRIPTVDELDAFLESRDRNKRAELVKQLLYGDKYQPELVGYWATNWLNMWVGRDAAAGGNDRIDSGGFRRYLEESLRENKPYDRLVYELLAAEGTNRPEATGFNGAVNFLAAKLDDKATQATADVARLFLGVQVQCTQCHNHPFNDWKQDQFWGLNSFFRQTVALRKTSMEVDDNQRVLELTDQDFAGENSRRATPEKAEVYYELRNGDLKSAYPTFLDGQRIDPSGYVDAVHRRRELARLVSQSDLLAVALVNRVWAHFLGYGFTRPIDDMGPHNPVSHPELLEYLAGEVRGANYDLRRLMEWIVLSEPYGLSSRGGRRVDQDNPSLGSPPKFARFYVRQMQPEQVYDSMWLFGRSGGTPALALAGQSAAMAMSQASAKDAAKDAAKPAQNRPAQNNSMGPDREGRQAWLRQFTINLGTDDGGETTTFNGTIPQTLMMFNGELTRAATKCEPETLLGQVWARSDLSSADKVQRLYRAALGRAATRRELTAYVHLVAASQGDEQKASEDLWWAILNSNEFILIH